jgi:hypothetical protein
MNRFELRMREAALTIGDVRFWLVAKKALQVAK